MENPDIHQRRSIRLKGYDYAQTGAYFVTICAQGRECLFGDVVKDEMVLNEYGRIVSESWTWLQQQYDYVEIREPNASHCVGAVCELPLPRASKRNWR